MGKSLALLKVKFASLQILYRVQNPLFSSFSILDIYARSEPFYDSPSFVTKRHLAVKQQPIFSIRTSNAGFGFERFTAGQGGVPFLNQTGYIFRMNRVGPAPPTEFFW